MVLGLLSLRKLLASYSWPSLVPPVLLSLKLMAGVDIIIVVIIVAELIRLARGILSAW